MIGPRAFVIFPSMALLAGFLGGMLGIGGGMIINPLLIEIGMHPQVRFVKTHIYQVSLQFFLSESRI